MCGIVGQAVYGGSADFPALERALNAMLHRGPDDGGLQLVTTLSGDVQVVLGNRRLAILDLSPAGHQPMLDPATGNWIVYNGEIYNFAEIRRELESQNVQFSSYTDTEVVLKSYAAWGERCPEHFRGMFGFALWDAARKRLLLCRDRLGIKPLYYYHNDRQLLFTSEARALLSAELIPKHLHLPSLADYLTFGSVCDPDTLVEGLQALTPGSWLIWEQGKIRQTRFWAPKSTEGNQIFDVADGRLHERLHQLLHEAVALHLVSDVPVGVFLSGGIDSSALVSLLSETERNVATFSIVFAEQHWSEAEYSSAVARRFHTDHHEITLSHEDFREALPDALDALDQPSIDGVNTYVVSREVRRRGMKVALSGLGSDEIFAGYDGFRRIPRLQSILRAIQLLPRELRTSIADIFRLLVKHNDANAKLAALLESDEASDFPYFLSRMLFLPRQRKQLLACGSVNDGAAYPDRDFSGRNGLDPVNRVSILELSNYMRNTLLRDADCMSMAHSLEVRVPYLDHKLVEFVSALPGRLKLDRKTPKPLLVSSLGTPLPDEVVYRPKRGFNLPFSDWLRGPLRSEIAGEFVSWTDGPLACYVSTQAVEQVWADFLSGRTSWSRPWSLYVLSRWVKRNLSVG